MTVDAIPPLPLGSAGPMPQRRSPLPEFPPASSSPPSPAPRPSPDFATPLRSEKAPRQPRQPESRAAIEPMPNRSYPGFTDNDLAEALRPLVKPPAAIPTSFPGSDEFEAAIRSAFRRTFAQYTASPFDPPDILRRALWRFDALVSSRSYEETLEEKIHRFRIEEIHLLDRQTLGLISFASVKPARHADARKVQDTANRIAVELARHPGGFPFDKHTKAVVRPGELTVMVALVRGRPDPLTEPDLDYALRRIEKTFGGPLRDGEPLLKEIQPLLEECLLIHSPIAPIPK